MEGTLQRSGKNHHLRFGSQAFVSQGLPRSQQDALAQACSKQGADKVISVLVDTLVDRSSGSSQATAHAYTQTNLPNQPGISTESLPDSGKHNVSGSARTSSTNNNDSDSQIWIFAFEDTVHERSAAALETLRQGAWRGRGSKQKQLRVMMLTGDNEASAQRVAQQLGIEDVRAGLSPEQKLQVCTLALLALPLLMWCVAC